MIFDKSGFCISDSEALGASGTAAGQRSVLHKAAKEDAAVASEQLAEAQQVRMR